MLIQGRYWLIKPLRQLHASDYIEVFEVNEDRNKQTKLSLLKAVKTAFRHPSTLLRASAAQVLYSPPKVLKVLKTNRNEKYAELFEQEARILTYLRHPGIPKAQPDENFSWRLRNNQELRCLVMEKIEGQNLQQWLQENQRISEENLALDWLKKIVEILDYVHQKGFFHRDIKPSNIMLKPDGSLVLIDFGTAREVTQTVINGQDVTVVCSPGYTAPEQVKGRAVPQSDFFALGRTFVHLLTGYHPGEFSVDSQTDQLIWRYHAPHISQELADFIDKLIAPSVQNRFQNTQLILQSLQEISESLPQQYEQTEPPPFQPYSPIPHPVPVIQSKRRIKRIIVGLIVILLLVVGIWKFLIPPSSSTCLRAPDGVLDVNEMAFSPDGNYIVTASLNNGNNDSIVRVFKSSSNNELVHTINRKDVVALKFSPDENKIAIASFDSSLGLWKMTNEGKISFLETLDYPNLEPLKNYIVALAFSPKGNFLAAASVGGSIQIFSTNSTEVFVSKRIIYGKYVKSISFSPDEKYLAIVGRDNKASVWKWKDEKEKDGLRLNDVVAVAFSPRDGKYLAIANAEGTVEVRNADNNFDIFKTIKLKTYPTAINFSLDGKHLLLLGWNQTAKLWSLENQGKLISLEQNSNDKVKAAAFSSKSGQYIATVNNKDTIKIWDKSGTFIKQLSQDNDNSLEAVIFNPNDDTQLALTGANGCLQIRKWSKFILGRWVFE
ncbi:serine/threonine-protein kinase [Nostoc sp. 106C]|uniref:serine/threonine-protein kinase n=1 Tax=Nostoc sp. 106C TaxID=1932667 RepID=UPI0030DB9A5B